MSLNLFLNEIVTTEIEINYFNKMRMPIYATERVQEALKREFAYIFAEDKYPGIPEIDVFTVNDKPLKINDIELLPIDVIHYRLPVKAYRIKDFSSCSYCLIVSNIVFCF